MMPNIFNLSKALCAVKREKVEHCVFGGIALVLASVAMSGEMLEIVAGLVGALVIYMMKERSSRRRTHVDRPVKKAACEPQVVGHSGGSGRKNTKSVKAPNCTSQTVPVHNISTRLHHAEPRVQLSFADGLSLSEQADELLRDVLPDKVDRSVCEELSRLVSPCIRKLIPEAQIDIVAHSSVVRIGRTGLRPEVDLVITVPPNVLAQRLLRHMRENANDHSVRKLDKIMEVDENTLNKFAIRVVSAQLSFCKLWRTAYRGVEPKVVLLAPKCLGVLSEDMHVHVYVNCPNTIRSKEVYNQSDTDVQKLVAFVRRWAQDRCIANTAYGHMPLYAWSLFAKYFCQSHGDNRLSGSTIELFGGFVDYYMKWLDSCSQTQVEAALQIEDPYDSQRNVAECMTATGMNRFREELERAERLLASKSSLTTILEHCNPLPNGARDVHDSVVAGLEEACIVESTS